MGLNKKKFLDWSLRYFFNFSYLRKAICKCYVHDEVIVFVRQDTHFALSLYSECVFPQINVKYTGVCLLDLVWT